MTKARRIAPERATDAVDEEVLMLHARGITPECPTDAVDEKVLMLHKPLLCLLSITAGYEKLQHADFLHDV